MHKHLLAGAALLAAFTTASAADIVVVGHPSAEPMSKQQVADIFLGKNPGLNILDQAETSPIRAEFYKKATGRDPSQIKATWSRLIFSGGARPPKEVPDAAAVKKAVAADPKGVGYLDKAAVDGSVKVLAVIE
jgi:ABC-type phosphate transport system substrate-binding protein